MSQGGRVSLKLPQDDRKLVWMYPKSHERFRLKLMNAEYASNSEELKVAAIYMIDFKTSSKMTENLLNRGNWKCWIFIDTRCKMPPWLWRITAFKLFFYKSWENDTLNIGIDTFHLLSIISLSAQDICYLVFPYVLCHYVCDWIVTSNHFWKCILHVTHLMLWSPVSSFILSDTNPTKENIIIY